MQLNVLTLPGDGIGVEVTREAVRVAEAVCAKFHHSVKWSEALLGGIAIHKTGNPFPDETARLALEADATLMGAVGLPEFDNWPPEKRPEKGLLGIRKVLGVYANLRPVRSYKALLDSSPLKNDRIDGTDLIIVRELNGGIYYGTPRGISGEGEEERGTNTMTYSRAEIARVCRMAFNLARDVAALAQGGGGSGRRVPRRHSRSPAGRQLRHAVGTQSQALRRPGDGEHVRRYPVR